MFGNADWLPYKGQIKKNANYLLKASNQPFVETSH